MEKQSAFAILFQELVGASQTMCQCRSLVAFPDEVEQDPALARLNLARMNLAYACTSYSSLANLSSLLTIITR